MEAWVPPPEFGDNGEPPPVWSDYRFVGEDFRVDMQERMEPLGNLVGQLAGPEFVDTGSKFHDEHIWVVANVFSGQFREALPTYKGPIKKLREEALRDEVEAQAFILNLALRLAERQGIPASSVSESLELMQKIEDMDIASAMQTDDYRLLALTFSKVFPGITGMKRIRHLTRWRRNEPTTQLPPGGGTKIANKVTVGISRTDAQELSASLGAEITLPAAVKLSSQVTPKIAQSVTFTDQREASEELTLTNDNPKHYRRCAIWNLVHEVQVHQLRGTSSTSLRWELRKALQFVSDSTAVVTSRDVPMPGS